MTPAEETEKWIDDLIFWEGIKDWMYLDSANPANVTTGIGFLLSAPSAAYAFPWEDSRGRPVGFDAVIAEFARIESIGQTYNATGRAQRSAGFYLNPTLSLRFPIEFARKFATKKLTDEYIPAIKRVFPLWDSIPVSARAAIVDMAWNLGVYKLETKFPSFCKAVNNFDYLKAASECHRKNVGDRNGGMDRNDWTKEKFLKAFREWMGRNAP